MSETSNLGKVDEQSNRNRWYVVSMLALVYASSQLDRQIMGILLEPIKLELGASDTEMGFLVGITFALFYATLGMPIAMLADRSNRRNIIATAITVWSAMTVVCGYVTTFTQMVFARIGVAVGESGSTPASNSIIADLFGPHERATAMSLFVVGANVGALISYLVGGWILDNWGWRTAFIAVGVPGIFIALLLVTTVKEPIRQIVSSTSSETGPEAAPGFWEVFKHMFAVPTLRHITIGKSLGGFVGYGFALWVPAFLFRTHELSATEIGLSMALVVGVAGAFGTLMSGRIVDWLARKDVRWRVRAIALSKVIPIPFAIAFLHLDQFMLAILAYVIPAALGAFYLAPSAALVQGLVKPRMRALAAAIGMFLINIIGMGLGPQGVGILSDLLRPEFADESLRWALSVFLLVNVWCAFHYWWAGRTIAFDLEQA